MIRRPGVAILPSVCYVVHPRCECAVRAYSSLAVCVCVFVTRISALSLFLAKDCKCSNIMLRILILGFAKIEVIRLFLHCLSDGNSEV